MSEIQKKLYPFKFKPAEFEKSYGKEKWSAADLGFADSEIENGWLSGNSMSDVMETYLERVVGENVYQFYGRQFPVFIKFIKLDGRTPLFVHPDDVVAMERYDALGRAKLLYIQNASKDSKLYIGFKREVSATEFFEKCLDGSIYEFMNEVVPVEGSHYFIEPGTVHAAAGKISMVCVSESSDANFVMHDDYATDEERMLQTTQISECLDYVNLGKFDLEKLSAHQAEGVVDTLIERPEFNVSKLDLKDPLHIYTDKFESFIIYVCVRGEASVQVPTETENGQKVMENYVLPEDEAILVPAELPDFYLTARQVDTKLLEVVTRPMEALDEYIDPSTEPYLEGEDYGGVEDMDSEDEEEDDED